MQTDNTCSLIDNERREVTPGAGHAIGESPGRCDMNDKPIPESAPIERWTAQRKAAIIIKVL